MANISVLDAIQQLTTVVDKLADKLKLGGSSPTPTKIYTLDAYGAGEDSGFPELKGTQILADNVTAGEIIGVKFSGKDDLNADYDFSDIVTTSNQWIIRIVREGANKFENIVYDSQGTITVRFTDTEIKQIVTNRNAIALLELIEKTVGNFVWRFRGVIKP